MDSIADTFAAGRRESRTDEFLAAERLRIDRNRDVVSSREQFLLQSARVLVAGCGSVGGSAVEPLVRLGVASLVLADPEDFDLTNINRQACYLSDVGSNKARVLGARARAINPHCETRVLEEGITEQNVADAIDGVHLVFDGIDAGAAPLEKYLVHAHACANRIPVMAGMDFGGKAVLYVFDYRRPGSRPFHGKASEQAHREHRFAECLAWLGYRHFPADFLPIISERLVSKRPWPQVAYCVEAMGALASRCAVDLLAGRPVPKVVSFDTHMAMRTSWPALRAYAAIPMRLVEAVRTSRRAPAPAVAASQVAPRDGAALPPAVREAIGAMALAPSPHNARPWRLSVQGDRVSLALEPKRILPCADPEGRGALASLGCAIEAAASIADVEFAPLPDHGRDGAVGTLHVRGLHEARFARNLGLLHRRATNRHPYQRVHVADALASACLAGAALPGTHVRFAQPCRKTLRALTAQGALRLFRRDDYLAELLDHLRFGEREERASGSGMTPRGLALGRAEALALRLLRASAPLRKVVGRLGLGHAMAANAARCIARSGGFVLVTTDSAGAQACLDGGRTLMRAWMQFTRRGVACQPLDFPLGFDEGRAGVLRMFGAAEGETPVALLRVGWPTRGASAAPRPGVAFLAGG
jgi:molybdopterin/thiamine biosynthesis adenylyltransferase